MSAPITIPTSELQALIGKAILDSLSADSRETILAAAVEHIIGPQISEDRYGKKTTRPSLLQIAFNVAVEKLIREVADELVTADVKPRLAAEMRNMLSELPESLENDWEIYSKLFAVLIRRSTDLAEEKASRRDLY